MIRLVDVHKSFGKKRVLRGIDLEIGPKKTTVILGPSGSGKSTVIKHMVGLLKPDSGDVWVDGINVASANEDDIYRVRKKVGFLFQSGALFDSMNIFENTAFPLKEHTKLGKKEIEYEVRKRLDMVGLKYDEVAHLYPDELSGGMQKRAGLARTIILNPEIILYDEPTSGLDPVGARNFDSLIVELRDILGITVVMITHDLDSIFGIVDRMAILADKHVVAEGPLKNVLQSQHPFVEDFFKNDYTKQKYLDKAEHV